MIEILKIKDIPQQPLDITPELAVIAYNVLRQYAERQQACKECVFNGDTRKLFRRCPQDWPEIEEGDKS